eukprot:5332437-Amphidinium_carterae.1
MRNFIQNSFSRRSHLIVRNGIVVERGHAQTQQSATLTDINVSLESVPGTFRGFVANVEAPYMCDSPAVVAMVRAVNKASMWHQ